MRSLSIDASPTEKQKYRQTLFSQMTSRVLETSREVKPGAELSKSATIQPLQVAQPARESSSSWAKKEQLLAKRMSKRKKYIKAQLSPEIQAFSAQTKKVVPKTNSRLYLVFLPAVLHLILSFDFGAFRKYLAICPVWYRALIAGFDEVCNRMENDFNMKYH